jgi:hypothetical protein
MKALDEQWERFSATGQIEALGHDLILGDDRLASVRVDWSGEVRLRSIVAACSRLGRLGAPDRPERVG